MSVGTAVLLPPAQFQALHPPALGPAGVTVDRVSALASGARPLSGPSFCLMRGSHSLLLAHLPQGAARLNHAQQNWALMPASLQAAGRSYRVFLKGSWPGQGAG